MIFYPRSFLALLLAGFTLVILPLVGALAYSAWNTERLAGKSRTAVFNASQAARASRSLVDRIAAIERVAQQMALLNDPRARAGLRARAPQLQAARRRDRAAAARRSAGRTRSASRWSTSRTLFDLLTNPNRPRLDAQGVGERVDALIDSARDVLAINNRVVDREVERLRVSAENVQRNIILLLIFSTAAALAYRLAL